MPDQLPIQKHLISLQDGIQIEYITAGEASGLPVVLLHGGGTDHALLSWRETIPVLVESGYRVYAPNYPGYGNSPLRGEPITHDKLINCLCQLMDLWNVGKAALVGISMGGALAIGYTLRHQERVSRLVLVGSYGLQDKSPYHHLSYFLVRMPWLMNSMWAMVRGSRKAAEYSLKKILFNPSSRTPEMVEEVLQAMQNQESQKAFGQWQRDEVRWTGLKTNYTPRLSEIHIPVLIVHGTKDIGVPLKYARRAAAHLPNAHLEVIEDAGHWTQRDYPQLFNQLLLEFLAEQSSA